nr:MAG: DNA pilot protein [Microvirus sp.]
MYEINNRVMGGISTRYSFNRHTECNWVGAAIGAASSLVGGLLGKKSQSDANATNLQIARETNASNQQLAEKQNQWNLDQWNRENEYNSAAAQKQRLIDAGMNPYWSSVTPGTAQNVQSAPMANQQIAHVEKEDALANAIPNAANSAFNAIMQGATAKKALADAKSAEAKANLDEQLASYNDSANPRRIIGLDLQNSSQQLGLESSLESIRGQVLQNRNTELRNIQQEGVNTLTNLQIENDKLQLSLQQEFGKQFKQAELDKLISEKGQIDSSTNVNVATISKIASDIAKNYAEVNHLNADTKTINSLRPYIIQKMGLENLGVQLSNLSTEYELGLNLKYGDKQKGQQLKTQEYENSFAGRARSWLGALSSILGVALGGAALVKGAKGSPKKVGTRTETDVYSNDELVKSIVRKSHDEYE